MMYSTSTSYAIRAMSRLAMIRPDGYARISEIVEGTELPGYFLSKIFRDLTRAGLLNSAKGRGGGFSLAIRPDKIRLYDIVEAVEGERPYAKCVVGLAKCDDTQPCPQHEHFKPVRAQMLSYLNGTTLDQMSEALARKIELLASSASCTVEGQ